MFITLRNIRVLLLLLNGCAGAGAEVTNLTTAGVAAAVGAATNPLVGLVVGLVTSYGVDQGTKYGARWIRGNVQDAIALAAANLGEGEANQWYVLDTLPLTGRTGTVQVVRQFGEAIPCKEIIFTVGDEPDFYVTTICRRGEEWRWATAEPSVKRWGGLQ